MYYEGWKIEIQNRPAQFLSDIWIFREGRNGKIEVWLGEKTVKEYEHEISGLPPALTIPTPLLEVLLQTIIGQGVKPPAESYVKGKLEATEKHLEDMRTLVFKGQPQ